jgi:hypothetical protein
MEYNCIVKACINKSLIQRKKKLKLHPQVKPQKQITKEKLNQLMKNNSPMLNNKKGQNVKSK